MIQRTLENTFTEDFITELQDYDGLKLRLFDIPVSDASLTIANKYYEPSCNFTDEYHQYLYMYFCDKHIEGTNHSAIPINVAKFEEFLALTVVLPNHTLDEAMFIEYIFTFGDPVWIERVLKAY